MDGRLEDVVDMAQSMRIRAKDTGAEGLVAVYARLTDFRARLHLGASLEALEQEVRGFFVNDELLYLVQAHLGRKEEVSAILDRMVVSRPGIGTLEDEIHDWIDCLYLEAAVLVGHRQAAELLLNRFSGTRPCTTGFFFPTCIARQTGGAAALLERYDEARQHYQEAIRVCTEMRFRPELALARLQLGELLLEHYPDEKKEAIEHLDFAIKEFREMKMQPSVVRALRHKDILQA
jgi:tetratricopeptide (TPR) repeat protein